MNIMCGVEYLGQQYGGWQKQGHDSNTVQEHVEKALSYVADSPIDVFCAGRTDSGVHATGQVIHFQTDKERPIHAWVKGANTQLPRDIRIQWAKEACADFHARFSAVNRRYHYWILNQPVDSAIYFGRMTHIREPLDAQKMHQAAQALLGEQDFTSFRAANCQSKTPMRRVDFVEVTQQGNQIKIDIQANAFLYHMVRNITGSLIQIGKGEQPVEWIKQLLALKDRNAAAPTAKPDGLYLVEVGYPVIS